MAKLLFEIALQIIDYDKRTDLFTCRFTCKRPKCRISLSLELLVEIRLI